MLPYDGKILIKEKISQQMMANLLGVNRVTLVRAVKELREMGFVEQINGFYCICDEVRMQQYMENGPGRQTVKKRSDREVLRLCCLLYT